MAAKNSRSRSELPKRWYHKDGELAIRVLVIEGGKRKFRWRGRDTGKHFELKEMVKR